jgi:phospho-N-acetylmuramoyl-pentapeptide-transferase
VLYFLLERFVDVVPPLRLINYISVRAAAAAVTALLLTFVFGPPLIRRLRAMRVSQGIREGTPDSHQSKGQTPTMGGLIILACAVVPTLLWARFDNQRFVVLALLVTLWMGAIGFLDDYLKLKQKREGKKNEGLVERYKLAGQVGIGLVFGLILWLWPVSDLPGASSTVPFVKDVLLVPLAGLAWIYVPWVTFLITGVSNSVNLTDGLDGLAAGLCAIALTSFALFAYVMGRVDASSYLQLFYLRGSGELTIFCLSLVGACIGFLWYNTHPAQVFMGDTGSLALGGALGAVAVLLKSEFLLLFVGGVFAMETVSVILQRGVFKIRKARYGEEYARANRVFLRAPIHHHFELKGWKESQVVVRFWILGVLCAFVALATLKLR